MKGIKHILFFGVLMSVFTCTTDESKVYNNSDGRFVRFLVVTNSNNEILEFPETRAIAPTTSNYEKRDLKTLKIPVALTSEPFEDTVTVNYEIASSGIENFEIFPVNAVSFTSERLVDTIFINFNERWDSTLNPEIQLRLTQSSDPNIAIGMPNSNAQNNEFNLFFEELPELTYGFETPNQVEIIGNEGEVVNFSVTFPNGYLATELDGITLIEEVSSGFAYSLEQLPLEDSDQIDYQVTLNESINIDELEFVLQFSLIDLDNFVATGSNTFTIKKPVIVPRDIDLNTASNFYDVSNSFYRTFGINWMDFNEDNNCEWRDFNAFTVPVVVKANNPNAILFDDMGTSDESDDIYHHAFRIGFVSPTSGNTTSPFNLKRWFNNESTSEENSPGFNIAEALEFFPENGSSSTNGLVQVIEQDLIISGTSGNSYVIGISGSGTYFENNSGIFEIELELNAFNQELFGGTRTSQYRIYNSQDFMDPELLTIDCFEPIDL